ncbi:hypothetical protein BpsS36_00025 [Bacillus phage vB_BpsS-36]|uniref:Uncharacterized protein n=1 Tax=Bacillus phage vB_BpsS-36 TaxID=2419622 RepID=A0A3G3BXS0_9CAUD|nr:hypothetical protein BpsS36_00025 [Bacillus phage vB_BpsS-36]
MMVKRQIEVDIQDVYKKMVSDMADLKMEQAESYAEKQALYRYIEELEAQVQSLQELLEATEEKE